MSSQFCYQSHVLCLLWGGSSIICAILVIWQRESIKTVPEQHWTVIRIRKEIVLPR